MELGKIACEVKNLKTKSQKRFLINLSTLVEQIRSGLVLRGPYRLVLDSNIIMRLESYNIGEVTEGLLSILLGFNFVKRLPYHIDVVVRPSVFYEFLRLKNVTSTVEHWGKFKKILDLVEKEIDGTLFFDGIETYGGAEYFGKLIENDAERIKDTLTSYTKKDWKFDFIREENEFRGFLLPNGLIEVPPFLAAQGLHTDIGLEYFDNNLTNRFFIDHIEKCLCECKSNDRKIIDKYNRQNRFSLASVLKLSSKGNLIGLADIDILSQCNVQCQFVNQSMGRYAPASIGFSVDEKLSKALQFFSDIHLSSPPLMGGEANISENTAKMEAFAHDQKRISEGEGREKVALEIAFQFFDELKASGVINDKIFPD